MTKVNLHNKKCEQFNKGIKKEGNNYLAQLRVRATFGLRVVAFREKFLFRLKNYPIMHLMV